MKQGDESNESEEKKKALEYLDEAAKKSEEYLDKTLEGLPDKVKREEFVKKVGDTWFTTYKLRMAITGRKSVVPEIEKKADKKVDDKKAEEKKPVEAEKKEDKPKE